MSGLAGLLPGICDVADKEEIERPVVVQIGDMQPYFTRKIELASGTLAISRCVPTLSFVLVGNSDDGAVGCTASRSRTPSLLASATATAFTSPKSAGKRALAELTLALVHEHVQLARSIDDRGIRIAVTVQDQPRQSRGCRRFRRKDEYPGTCHPRCCAKPWARPCWPRGRYPDRRRLRYPPPRRRCKAR